MGPAGPWGFHPYPSQLVPGTQEVPAQCFLQEQKAGANRGLAGSSLNSFCSPGGSPSPHGGEVLLCEPGHETQNCPFIWAPLGAHTVKSLPAMQETPVPPLGLEYLPEKRMATHCSCLENPKNRPWGCQEVDMPEKLPLSLSLPFYLGRRQGGLTLCRGLLLRRGWLPPSSPWGQLTLACGPLFSLDSQWTPRVLGANTHLAFSPLPGSPIPCVQVSCSPGR